MLPVGDNATFLDETLTSLLSNLDSRDEAIICLNGAGEAEAKLVGAFSKRFLGKTLVLRAAKKGLTRALNAGLAVSSGKYVMRIDSDDILMPGRLDTQIAMLEKRSGLAAVGGQALFINENGDVLGISELPIFNWQIRLEMKFSNPLIHPAMTYRRSELEAIGGYNLGFRLAQDYELASRILLRGKITNMSKPVIKYRLHDGQVSSSLASQRVVFVAKTLYEVNGGGLKRDRSERIAQLLANTSNRKGVRRAFLIFLSQRPVVSIGIILSKMLTRTIRLFGGKRPE